MNGMIRGGIVGAILALAINIAIYFIGNSQEISWSVINAPSPEVTLTMVIVATIVAAVGAIIVMWLLQRFSNRPVHLFLWIALIVGLLSLIPVYTSTQSRATLIALGLMHVGATIGITWGMLYGLRQGYSQDAS